MPTTANFGWTTPVEDGSPGVWDTILNDLADAIDASLQTVKTTADAALPLAGGTVTGEVTFKTTRLDPVDKGAMSGAVTLDLDDANYFYGTKTGAVTFTFSNFVSAKVEFFVLEMDNTAAGAITWPAAVVWDLDTPPTIDSADVQTFVFWSRDGGTVIHGKLVHQSAT